MKEMLVAYLVEMFLEKKQPIGATSMKSVSVFVGLDYHQSGVQVCVLDRDGKQLVNRCCINEWEEIVAAVPSGSKVFAAIESCCGAANLADELITKGGWSVHLAHPGYVARMKQSPDKTDFTDARLLADLERVGYLPKVWLAPEYIRELRRLVRYRQQLAEERRNTKLRIRALLREHRIKSPVKVNAWTIAWTEWVKNCKEISTETRWIIKQHFERLELVKKQLRTIEKRLQDFTLDDPVVQKLLEQDGVGLVTAVTLRAEIGRFDRFRSGKQLARFCSVTPRNASSGERQADAGLIKAGNPELRRILIEAAHRLSYRTEKWSSFATAMRARGKPTCVITAAIANRWIRGLYHTMKSIAA